MNLSYQLFRRLCATLEIRDDSPADRDRALYHMACRSLGMLGTKPKSFFEAHPEISDLSVLQAFLDTFEPFAKMTEFIFSVSSQAPRGATGGRDLIVKYDESANSLRFDVDAFRRFRELRVLVQGRVNVPRYHSDFVPSFGFQLRSLADRRWPSRRSRQGAAAAVGLEELDNLLSRARNVGAAHIAVVDEFLRFVPGDVDERRIEEWFRDRGVTGDYLPRSRQSVEAWGDSIRQGLAAVESVTADRLHRSMAAQDLSNAVSDIARTLAEIAIERDAQTWKRSVEAWLELPFWQKRWQVYETWAFVLWLSGLLTAGGRINADEQGQIVLRTGRRSEAIGVLPLTSNTAMELWMEYALTASRNALRPDIALVLRHGKARVPVRIIECKQRVGWTARQMWRDASKYLRHLPLDSDHILVNYDAYADGVQSYGETRRGRRLTAVGDVRPDGAGIGLVRSLIVQTFSREVLRASKESLWVILVDTTGSMHCKIPDIVRHIGELQWTAGLTTALLIVYGDHTDAYVAQVLVEASEPAVLQHSLIEAPRTQGGDEPEALEDALHLAVRELDARGSHSAEIVVFTDAPSHPPSNCPSRYDFKEEVARLVEQGCGVTIVACGVQPSALGFDDVPGCNVTTLDQHDWPLARASGVAV